MKTELKTLEDFETFDLAGVGTNEKIVYSKDLKAKAVKWINVREKEYDKVEGKGYGRQYLQELIDFLNIKEEDLD